MPKLTEQDKTELAITQRVMANPNISEAFKRGIAAATLARVLGSRDDGED